MYRSLPLAYCPTPPQTWTEERCLPANRLSVHVILDNTGAQFDSLSLQVQRRYYRYRQSNSYRSAPVRFLLQKNIDFGFIPPKMEQAAGLRAGLPYTTNSISTMINPCWFCCGTSPRLTAFSGIIFVPELPVPLQLPLVTTSLHW